MSIGDILIKMIQFRFDDADVPFRKGAVLRFGHWGFCVAGVFGILGPCCQGLALSGGAKLDAVMFEKGRANQYDCVRSWDILLGLNRDQCLQVESDENRLVGKVLIKGENGSHVALVKGESNHVGILGSTG